MKAIGILTLLMVLSYYLITLFEPEEGTFVLTKDYLDSIERDATIQKILGVAIIVFEALLLYKIYIQITKVKGSLKSWLMLYFGVILIVLIVGLAIIYKGLTSVWF